MTARPYPDYRPSGVPWLGDVPAHWELQQLGRIGQLFKGGGGTKEDAVDEGYPCVRYGDIYTQHEFFIRRARACISEERTDSYTPIQYGDVLFAGSGETIEEIGKSAVNLIEGRAYCGGDVVVFRPSVDVNAAFSGYALDCPQSSYQKSCMGRGITVMHIYSDELKYMAMPLPPPDEQAAIVRFLDHADRRIQRYIGAKQDLIGLLEEQKQAVIQRAVTRGLDPEVRLKPSGVEWLGDVPEHWEVRRLKTLCSESALYGANISAASYSADGVRFLRTTDITDDGELRPGGVFLPSEAARDYMLNDGDLLVSRSGTVGRSLLYKSAIHGPCAYAGYLVRFVPASIVAPEYLFKFTKTQSFSEFLRIMAISSTIENVNGEKYSNAQLPFPPLPEQAAISRYLDDATANIGAAIERAHREIELLREYRTRLIADVVTGKLDVREAAAALPAEAADREDGAGMGRDRVASRRGRERGPGLAGIRDLG